MYQDALMSRVRCGALTGGMSNTAVEASSQRCSIVPARARVEARHERVGVELCEREVEYHVSLECAGALTDIGR